MQIPLWLEQDIVAYGYWAVLVAVMLESMGVPFPGETALLAGAIYAGTTGHLDIALVIAAAAAGAILGDNIGFWHRPLWRLPTTGAGDTPAAH